MKLVKNQCCRLHLMQYRLFISYDKWSGLLGPQTFAQAQDSADKSCFNSPKRFSCLCFIIYHQGQLHLPGPALHLGHQSGLITSQMVIACPPLLRKCCELHLATLQFLLSILLLPWLILCMGLPYPYDRIELY